MIVDAQAELLRYRLAQPVGGSGVASADLLIVTLHDDAGRVGLGFSYVLGGRDRLPLDAASAMLERFVTGKPPAHPEARWREIAASFNRTGGGPYATALAALDVAGWDLYAKTLGVPLGVAMGGAPRAVPVYGSGFFSAGQDPDAAAAAAVDYVRRGVLAVKLRAAGDARDGAALRAVASAVSNVAAYRALARIAATPLATGEHLRTVAEADPFLTEGLCAVIQPDLQAMGGLTPCLRLARIAEAANVEVAPHFLPGLFVHLATAAPNVTWLEDFPLLEPLFAGWPEMTADGKMAPVDAPGHGLTLAEGVRETYASRS